MSNERIKNKAQKAAGFSGFNLPEVHFINCPALAAYKKG